MAVGNASKHSWRDAVGDGVLGCVRTKRNPERRQEHKQLQQIDRNAAQQKPDARTDRADLAQDKAALHNDVKNGDMAGKKEQRKARQAKNDLSQDQQNINPDQGMARQIRSNAQRGAHG